MANETVVLLLCRIEEKDKKKNNRLFTLKCAANAIPDGLKPGEINVENIVCLSIPKCEKFSAMVISHGDSQTLDKDFKKFQKENENRGKPQKIEKNCELHFICEGAKLLKTPEHKQLTSVKRETFDKIRYFLTQTYKRKTPSTPTASPFSSGDKEKVLKKKKLSSESPSSGLSPKDVKKETYIPPSTSKSFNNEKREAMKKKCSQLPSNTPSNGAEAKIKKITLGSADANQKEAESKVKKITIGSSESPEPKKMKLTAESSCQVYKNKESRKTESPSTISSPKILITKKDKVSADLNLLGIRQEKSKLKPANQSSKDTMPKKQSPSAELSPSFNRNNQPETKNHHHKQTPVSTPKTSVSTPKASTPKDSTPKVSTTKDSISKSKASVLTPKPSTSKSKASVLTPKPSTSKASTYRVNYNVSGKREKKSVSDSSDSCSTSSSDNYSESSRFSDELVYKAETIAIEATSPRITRSRYRAFPSARQDQQRLSRKETKRRPGVKPRPGVRKQLKRSQQEDEESEHCLSIAYILEAMDVECLLLERLLRTDKREEKIFDMFRHVSAYQKSLQNLFKSLKIHELDGEEDEIVVPENNETKVIGLITWLEGVFPLVTREYNTAIHRKVRSDPTLILANIIKEAFPDHWIFETTLSGQGKSTALSTTLSYERPLNHDEARGDLKPGLGDLRLDALFNHVCRLCGIKKYGRDLVTRLNRKITKTLTEAKTQRKREIAQGLKRFLDYKGNVQDDDFLPLSSADNNDEDAQVLLASNQAIASSRAIFDIKSQQKGKKSKMQSSEKNSVIDLVDSPDKSSQDSLDNRTLRQKEEDEFSENSEKSRESVNSRLSKASKKIIKGSLEKQNFYDQPNNPNSEDNPANPVTGQPSPKAAELDKKLSKVLEPNLKVSDSVQTKISNSKSPLHEIDNDNEITPNSPGQNSLSTKDAEESQNSYDAMSPRIPPSQPVKRYNQFPLDANNVKMTTSRLDNEKGGIHSREPSEDKCDDDNDKENDINGENDEEPEENRGKQSQDPLDSDYEEEEKHLELNSHDPLASDSDEDDKEITPDEKSKSQDPLASDEEKQEEGEDN